MSSISAISGGSNYYQQLSSGKRINSAADDAAGLAIAEKMKAQSNGYDVGTENTAAARNLLNVSDGALSSVTDSIQRMYELSLRASNQLYGDDELSAIQEEIDLLKQSITDIAANTNFNEIKLLDGSKGSINVAAGPDGDGPSLSMANSTLEALGIADYDVTGTFDIQALSSALKKVSGARSTMGAQTNALEHVINYNGVASHNLTASRSRIEDLDYPQAISDLKTKELMENYRLHMQKKKAENAGGIVRLLNFN